MVQRICRHGFVFQIIQVWRLLEKRGGYFVISTPPCPTTWIKTQSLSFPPPAMPKQNNSRNFHPNWNFPLDPENPPGKSCVWPRWKSCAHLLPITFLGNVGGGSGNVQGLEMSVRSTKIRAGVILHTCFAKKSHTLNFHNCQSDLIIPASLLTLVWGWPTLMLNLGHCTRELGLLRSPRLSHNLPSIDLGLLIQKGICCNILPNISKFLTLSKKVMYFEYN